MIKVCIDSLKRLCVDGTSVNILVDEVRGHVFDAHRSIPSEQNGQPHWLSLAYKEGGKIRASQQRGFVCAPLLKMRFGQRFLK